MTKVFFGIVKTELQLPLGSIMCFDFDLNQLFCCCSNRLAGVKAIGFIGFVIDFLCLIGPIYEINYFRSNETVYDNSTFVHVPILKDGG